MRVALYGESAFAYYLVAGDAPSAVAPPSVLDKSCYPTQATLDYVRERMPYLTRPVHCLVPKWERCSLDDVHLHGSSYPYRSGSFLRIDHGVIVPCPELCFLQLAQSLDLLPLIQAGCFLCATFGLDPSVPSGLMGRTPLTSPRRIGAYLERCPGHDGLTRVREALRFVCAEAASPPEVFMRLVLGLPARLVGFGLSGSVMNKRIKPSKRAKALAGRESLVPDLYLPDCKLDIEFDSNAEHLTARQATLDATKRMALESDGLKVITVTTSQLASASAMRHVAQEAHARRGTRLRLRCKNFALRQKRLYHAMCASLLQLRNAFWPKPTKMACQNAVSATFLARDAVNADFLAVEGLHRNAAVCHCVYFLDCPDCRVPLCSFSRVFFLLRFLSAIVSGE